MLNKFPTTHTSTQKKVSAVGHRVLTVWISSAPAQTATGEETAPEDNAEYNVD